MHSTNRIMSLDVFRGITITLMIFANNPGSWSFVYAPFKHAEWNGWTLTDCIFPFFIFIMGISLALSLTRKIDQGIQKAELYKIIIKRCVILFSLGLFLNLLSINLFAEGYNWYRDTLLNVRIMGVLQRLALVYGITACLFLNVGEKFLIRLSVIILLMYWLAMYYWPYSAVIHGVITNLTGVVEPDKNLAAYVDHLILGQDHVYFKELLIPYDPEGILSTLTASVSCIVGAITGIELQKESSTLKRMTSLFAWGVFFLFLGQIWNYQFPINKTIWSSSYVVFMSGMALISLAFSMYLIDYKKIKNWTHPFVVFGANAIAFFMFSGILARVLLIIRIGDQRLRDWLYINLFSPMFGSMIGSLMYSIVFLFLSYLLMNWLYKRNLFWKV